MRPASLKYIASVVVAATLLSSGVTAAPTIADWQFDTNGEKEMVTLRWDEAGAYQVNEFPQTREVIVVFPSTRMAPTLGQRLDVAQSHVLERARLQQVTTASGDAALQLRLNLRDWTQVQAHPTDEGLTLAFTRPERARPSAARGPVLSFTDADVAALDGLGFGDFDAPSTGAGQTGQSAPPPSNTLSDYYLPPDVDRSSANVGTGPTDISELSVQNKLNDTVVRVDFQGTTLENVLRLISERAELNILIKPSDVAGRTVTFRLRDVTLRQMLDAILKANDLGYTIEEGGIVRIVPRSQVKSTAKETVTETVALNWVDARDVMDALTPFVDREDGTIQVSEATNLLIIRDVPENVQRMLDLISQIDQPEKQVMIEMRLVNLSETARREFGTRTGWMSQETDPRSVVGADGFVGSITNTGSSASNFNGSQTVGAGGKSFSNTFTNTATAGSTFTEQVGLAPVSAGSAGLLGTTAEAFQLSQLTTVQFLGKDFDVDFAINAQEERGEAVTLANPKVLSLNNNPARVEIKREIPYVSAVNSDQGSVGTIEFKDVGTEVEILPRITNHGWIMMQIKPEQIIDTGERPQGVPVTDERRVEASVIVKDETTVAIGGLRSFSSTASEIGVPYLLRVPVLSWLFKRQVNTQNKTELYLFVTPHILKDPTPTPYQMAMYDKIDYNWDLPDYYFDEVTARKSPDEMNDPSAKFPANK